VSGEIDAYRLSDKVLKEKYKPFFEGMQCVFHWFSPVFCIILVNTRSTRLSTDNVQGTAELAPEKYVIGIDGGGTKTTALLTSLDGTVVAEARGGAANMAVAGASQTADVIFALILQCCTYAGCTFDDLQNIVLGLAGMGRKGERAELSNALFDLATKRGSPLRNIRIETDAEIALEAAFAGGPGIVVIAGTGAVAVYRAENGEQIRAGGWGRILGDEGSGYALGRDGLNAVMRELDGRGDKTLLTKKALEHYGVTSVEELIQKVYYDAADVAGFSRRVLEAITERDHVANRIAVDNVNELVNLAAVLVKKQPPKRKLPVALMGSLLETENPYAKMVRERIPAALPQLLIMRPKFPAAYGAVILALDAFRS